MYILYLVFSCIVLPCWRNKVYIIGSASNTNLLSELGTLFPEPTILTKKSEFTLKIVGKKYYRLSTTKSGLSVIYL